MTVNAVWLIVAFCVGGLVTLTIENPRWWR